MVSIYPTNNNLSSKVSILGEMGLKIGIWIRIVVL